MWAFGVRPRMRADDVAHGSLWPLTHLSWLIVSISTFISPHWVTHCVVGMQVCGAELLVDSEMPCRYKKARLNRGYGSYQDRPHP